MASAAVKGPFDDVYGLPEPPPIFSHPVTVYASSSTLSMCTALPGSSNVLGRYDGYVQEKSALQTRNKILETVVVLNTRHEKRLHCNQVDQHQLCLGSVLFQEVGWAWRNQWVLVRCI